MNQLLINYVFAKQVWHWFSVAIRRPKFETRDNKTLGEWCIRQDERSDGRRPTRAMCLLGMWMLWKHRNDIVFNGASPSFKRITQRIEEEDKLWRTAGLFRSDGDGYGVAAPVRVDSE